MNSRSRVPRPELQAAQACARAKSCPRGSKPSPPGGCLFAATSSAVPPTAAGIGCARRCRLAALQGAIKPRGSGMAKSRKKARKAAKRPAKRAAKRKTVAKAKPRKAAKKSKPRKAAKKKLHQVEARKET